jgi:hypothetical protein
VGVRHGGQWVPDKTVKFGYAGWMLIAQLDGGDNADDHLSPERACKHVPYVS